MNNGDFAFGLVTGAFSGACLTLVVLKLSGVIDWSWWVAFTPMGVFALGFAALATIATISDMRSR